jgi:hypothetical protein
MDPEFSFLFIYLANRKKKLAIWLQIESETKVGYKLYRHALSCYFFRIIS